MCQMLVYLFIFFLVVSWQPNGAFGVFWFFKFCILCMKWFVFPLELNCLLLFWYACQFVIGPLTQNREAPIDTNQRGCTCVARATTLFI